MSAVLITCSKRLLLKDFFITLPAAAATSSSSHVIRSPSTGHFKSASFHDNPWTSQNASAQSRTLPYSTAASSVSTLGLSATTTRDNGGESQRKAIRITDKCKERLREILEEKGTFLRVAVEGGGCSGFQYKFEIDSQLCDDDIVIASEERKRRSGARNGSDAELNDNVAALVVIDQMSLDLIQGSTLDYETELIRSTFRVINNPLAEQGCSCGASFNMKI